MDAALARATRVRMRGAFLFAREANAADAVDWCDRRCARAGFAGVSQRAPA